MILAILLICWAVTIAVAGGIICLAVKVSGQRILFSRACLVALLSGILYTALCSFLPTIIAAIGGFIIFGALLRAHSTVTTWTQTLLIALVCWLVEIFIAVGLVLLLGAILAA